MKKRYSALTYFIFFLTGIFLIMQFSQVMIYFDDYGYYSLNYGVLSSHRGSEYTFVELFRFLKAHYILVNGRVLYFGIWLIVYKLFGIVGVQLCAGLTVWTILYLFWALVKRHRRLVAMDSTIAAMIVCSLYWLVSITVHQYGTYWFAAFFN